MTKAEKTRQFIIEKSSPLFNVKGIAGTVMSDIMEATRLAKGSLYVHFDDKEDLSRCVVDYNLNLVVERPLEAASKQKTARAKLIAFLSAIGERHPSILGGCPILNLGMEADDTNPVIRNKVGKAMKKMLTTIQTFVSMGIKAGEFKKNWNAEEFAAKSFALLEGGIMMAKISGSADKRKVIMEIIKKEIEENSI
jgi:TetR/AcrR family transcriptional repressor of nem operon